MPRVCCILPTKNRPIFAAQAIAYFQAQTYADKHLYILQNDDTAALVTNVQDNIDWDRFSAETTTGILRNRLVDAAKGDIILHWDDDDYYGPDRIAHQVLPIVQDKADVTLLKMQYLVDIRNWQGWQIHDLLQQEMFAGGAHTGTLCYRKKYITDLIRYPEHTHVGEDAILLKLFTRAYTDYRMTALPQTTDFVYIRHATNTWDFNPGTHIAPDLWKLVNPTSCFPSTEIASWYHEQHLRLFGA